MRHSHCLFSIAYQARPRPNHAGSPAIPYGNGSLPHHRANRRRAQVPDSASPGARTAVRAIGRLHALAEGHRSVATCWRKRFRHFKPLASIDSISADPRLAQRPALTAAQVRPSAAARRADRRTPIGPAEGSGNCGPTEVALPKGPRYYGDLAIRLEGQTLQWLSAQTDSPPTIVLGLPDLALGRASANRTCSALGSGAPAHAGMDPICGGCVSWRIGARRA